MADKDKVRHTFHIHEAVMDKLRDAVKAIQDHPERYPDVDLEQYDNLSRFAQTAIIAEIETLEQQFKAFPRRRKNERVHFGRPPLPKDEQATA